MLAQGWILLGVFLVSSALSPIPHRTSEESLRSALNAVVRKQRSLDPSAQEYYNDLHAFKYHGGDPERKFEREGHNDCQVDEQDEEIEFLPETGQLETVGNGFQSLNNKLLERALMDYTENMPEQAEPVQSLFRERERSSSRKRGSSPDRLGIDSKELAKLLVGELQTGTPYGPGEMSDEEYLDTLQMLYDKYGSGQGNKLYDEGPMSWGELLNKEALLRAQAREAEENEYADRDQDQSVLYLSPAERRNVNGRYPIGRDLRTYRSLVKRYPVAKRSPKPLTSKKQITDPKVAQDLGALFGTQSTDTSNHTHSHTHDHTDSSHNHETTSEAPKVTAASKGQKENVTKMTKSKSIEVRKKSVDWSQYFGIDRRKKKASFMPGQGTQNQDDEWMLQRYYENMAENLRPSEQVYESESERKDRLEPSDSRLKGIKHLLVEKLLRHAEAEDTAELQKVKDKLMASMVAAYSLEKMRKALNELKSNAESNTEAQRTTHSPTNITSNFRENEAARTDEKRNNMKEEESEEPGMCLELEIIEEKCRTTDNLCRDGPEMLYRPCVMLQICRACVQDIADLEDDMEDECLASFMEEAKKACDAEEIRAGRKGRKACVSTTAIVSRMQPPPAMIRQCYMNENNCLRRYHYRYRHRYMLYPYGGHRSGLGYGGSFQQQAEPFVQNNIQDIASAWLHKASKHKEK